MDVRKRRLEIQDESNSEDNPCETIMTGGIGDVIAEKSRQHDDDAFCFDVVAHSPNAWRVCRWLRRLPIG